jgi:hypothetical protein
MRSTVIALARNNRGASAAEFALVLPLLLLFLLGTIDVGRYLWALNRAEKASQMGVRYAVVSDPVANIMNADFVDYGIPGGDAVPTAIFGTAECSAAASCTVTGAAADSSRDPAAFTAVVNWMHKFDPRIQASNVWVTYENVGLGYSGDPNGPDIAALTTVELRNLRFHPFLLFGGTITLPPIKASLTLEDGECSTTGDCGSSN